MKILYISQYYPPEMGAPSARVSELARDWARRGHDVTVLTAFPHHPHGVKDPGDRGVLTRAEQDGDVRVVRTYVYATRNSGFVKRTLSYLSFMFSAVLIGTWRVGRPDVVIATSPQLFTAVAGRAISWLKWRPFVFEVRDLWPESIVTVGAMKDSLAIRCLKALAHGLYRSCQRIVTVGEGYARGIHEGYGVPKEKMDVVTNGVDLNLYQPDEDARQRLRAEHQLGEKKVVLYLGTHGMAHGLNFVLEAAKRLKDRQNLHFVFVGDGAEKPALVRQAQDTDLENVTFMPPVGKEDVVAWYAASDMCLVPLRKVDLFRDVLPSKLFEIMSMRRPIVLSVDGESRKVVERAEAGVFVEPENVDALVGAVIALCDDDAKRQRLGENGRRHVEEFYSRTVLAGRYLSVLDRLVRESPVPAASPAKAKL